MGEGFSDAGVPITRVVVGPRGFALADLKWLRH
jgi:hypothetical protein